MSSTTFIMFYQKSYSKYGNWSPLSTSIKEADHLIMKMVSFRRPFKLWTFFKDQSKRLTERADFRYHTKE
uniref:Uncharacterized protein n=1 Tax=Lepeophtheirus salmonis TaxID=72036 RepID=A0A0K2UH77_LEPSM